MHLILVFFNNCIIIFYTLYLLKFNFAQCVSNTRNCHTLVFPTFNSKINRNVNNLKFTPTSGRFNKRNLSKLCIINNEFITLKPVQVSVNTFWGKDSQFNANFVISANLNDTFRTVKDFLFKKTGIPTEVQQLYINTNNSVDKDNIPSVTSNKLIKVVDSDKLNKYLNHFKVSKLKELELDLVLDLPAPVYKNMKPDLSRIEEYVSGLIKYTELLKDANNATLSSKFDSKSNIVERIKESTNYASKLHYNDSKSTEMDNLEGDSDVNSSSNVKGNKNLAVKRVYVRLFRDLPPDTHLFNKRLKYFINHYFPLNTSATVKFTLFCLLLRLNKGYDKAILDAVTLMPLIALIMQTRPGIFLNKLLFHLIASQGVPKILYNLLPSHLAQKFHSNRT
nr:hypothetical protein MACL_00000861 [Theileria orientalis]